MEMDKTMLSLSERIAVRVKGHASCLSNRGTFLAVREDVRQALDDGWSVLRIHRLLQEEGVVTFSYQAFRRYVNELVLANPDADKNKGVRSMTEPAAMKKRSVGSRRGFVFNPAPNKEDLF
jgi:hypothetical protein